MPKHSSFRDLPCAYCGRVTLNNTPDHVVPRSLFPKSYDPHFRRLTVPACNLCQAQWMVDEELFKGVIISCGPEPSRERVELWASVVRGFKRERGGRQAYLDFASTLVEEPDGMTVYPDKNRRVVHVVSKIVRGLCYHHNPLDDLGGHSVAAKICKGGMPRELAGDLLTLVYEAPCVFEGRAVFFAGTAMDDVLHSAWELRFFNSAEFIATVERPGARQ